MQPIRTITADDVESIAQGAALLACGSGGDPLIGALLARQAIAQHGPVPLVAVESLPEDALVVPGCMLGDPAILSEKPPQGDELVQALHVLERVLDRPASAVICAGTFGLNLTLALALAAAARLPLIDGDGTGRALPGLRASGFALHGVSATPMVLCDDKGNSLTIETVSDDWAEGLARTATAEMGGVAMTTLFPMTGGQAQRAVIAGTVSLSARIGAALHSAEAPVSALCDLLPGRVLTTGRVQHLNPAAAQIGAQGGDAPPVQISFADVLLSAGRAGQTIAASPQALALIDPASGRPIPFASLTPGQRVALLTWPAAPVWSAQGGAAMAGPAAFGGPAAG
ncbi:MAG: DUF917 family protein [Paracoccus sp. (in: a-proteobacteria)]|uniref:DUF917 domain-containing protein n=1 Tax=Paracoccus sp. TaxID=267 RepID=UPI0026E0D1B2|nr:DUF917 family protein [Paracoccus sp. (in: a-proteobacteria)]MDO5613701.1 DUF917 family protein [Paracoccus sp. (in: a-proteobacteria)]